MSHSPEKQREYSRRWFLKDKNRLPAKREYDRQRIARFKKKGLCIFCSGRNPSRKGRTNCKTCAVAARLRAVTHRYGLSVSEYQALLTIQGGRCAICCNVEKVGRVLSVDHDHSCCPGTKTCGKCIRGLLCQSCNNGLGYLADSILRLDSAIQYLKRYSNGRVS